MILNTYSDWKIWLRYYIQKNSPVSFYPILLNFFYKQKFQKNININNPQTFSEKLNYLKIYNVTKEKEKLSDKLYSKNYVKNNIPEINIAKVYQEGFTFDEIDFDKAPNTFIMKTNHACKTGILINDKNAINKIDIERYRRYYNKVLNINYAFWGTLELQYRNIVPKIYLEEYLCKEDSYMIEYEVHCINGIPEFIECRCNDIGVSFYDKNWNKANFVLLYPRFANCYPNETNKKKIIKFAEILSKDFLYVRIDFFEINDVLYFGEMTFTPMTGNINFVPQNYDLFYGKKLDISSIMES